jgi:hypothetical protein
LSVSSVVVLATLILIPGLPWGIQQAHAEILTFAMEGNVTSITDFGGFLDFVSIGDRFVYEFTFDTDAPDLNATPRIGQYDGISATATVSEFILPAGSPSILIQHPSDEWHCRAFSVWSG